MGFGKVVYAISEIIFGLMFGNVHVHVCGPDHDQKHTYALRSNLLYFQSGALSTATLMFQHVRDVNYQLLS